MQNSLRRAIVGSVLFILGVLACSSRDNPEERTGVNKGHLTSSELGRVLSFEGALGSSGDWVASAGTVASSAAHASAGTHSMVMSGAYSISVTSTALSALGSVGTKMSLDIWLPSALVGQSNKGNIQAFFNSSTLQLYNYATSNVQLTSLTPGQFSRSDIPLDSTLTTKLSQSGYADLTIKLAFNLADITHQTFVDNLVFSPGIAGTGGSSGTGGTRALGGTTSTTVNSGGASPTGGTASNGGTASLGGTKTSDEASTVVGNGGALVMGGAPGNGGELGLGGAIVYAGGTPASGGLSSAVESSLTGGAPASGGAGSGGVSTANTSATGAAGSTSGGSTSTGGTGATGGGTAYTFSFQLPKGVIRSQVLFATTEGDLSIEDGVNAYDGSGYASVSSVSEGKVNRIGVASQVQNVWSDGDVQLANNATVHGSLVTSGDLDLQAGAQVLGTTTEQADLTEVETVSWTVNLPTNTLPAVSLIAAQTLSPGQYPEFDIKTGGQLSLTKGTYTFNAMMVEPGASLNIDNRQGPVFIYLRDGFTFRGTITSAATQANVLFGIAGTNPVVIDSAFTGIIVAPKTSITLATVATQHKGAFFAQSILARKNKSIVLNALDSANFCTGSAACSSFCPCAAGASKTCTDNSSCQAGSVCGSGNGAAFGLPSGSNVCWPASCQVMAGIGSQCSRFPQACQSDTECPSGEVCGQSNGAQFLFAANRVCWPAQCATDPVGAGCGTPQMPCGFCTTSCAANCATKKCGDSPDDGCGGVCVGYCSDGAAGCTSNTQCHAGSVCSPNGATYYGQASGQSVCWPLQCDEQKPSQRDCGKATAACGPQCPSNDQQCANRQCGVDPAFGASCGTCAAGQFCNNAGQCQSQTKGVILNVPPRTGNGEATTVPSATDVGAIPANLTVTQQGRAHYSVPLFVPPGVNGLTPRLSLEYESTVQDSEVGVGWSIGGLSRIARCPRNFAENYARRGPGSIGYDDSDQYCLDGTPLLRISAEAGDGAEYRTEYDSMVRVISHVSGYSGNYTGPDSFDVYSPDGRVSRYGGKGQYSIWSATGTYGDWSSAGARTTWALTHVQDLQGNTIEYLYELDSVYTLPGARQMLPGQSGTPMAQTQGSRPVIYEIDYGGTTTTAGNRKITFAREHLWDDSSRIGAQRFGWYSGVPYEAMERVSRISMFYDNTEVRSYLLQYEADGRRSKLANLYECAQKHCKQPTSFTYKQPQSLTFSSPTTIDLGGQGLVAIQSTFDADGDGLMDFLINPFLDPDNPATCSGWLFAKNTGVRSNPYVVSQFAGAKPGFDNSCQTAVSTVDLNDNGRDEVYGSFQKGEIGGDMMSWTTEVEYDPGSGAWNLVEQTNSYFYNYKTDLNGDGFMDSEHTTAWGTLGYGIDTDSDGVPNEIKLIPNETTAGYSQLDVNVAGTSAALGVRLPMITVSRANQDVFIRAHSGSAPKSCVPPCVISEDNPYPNCYTWSLPVPPDKLKCTQKEEQFAGIATGMKLLDVNGDGLKDILTWNVGVSEVVCPDGTILPDASSTCLGGFHGQLITWVTGKSPVSVYIGPSKFLTLWINTGRNQFVSGYTGELLSQGTQQTLDSFLNAGSFKQSFVYDVNKDGLEDLVIVDPTSRKIYALIMGPDQGIGAKFNLQQLASAGVVPDWFSATSQVMVLDVDGDGAADIVFGDGKKVAVAYQGGADHDLLATVTDGNGRVDTVSYVAGAQDADHYSYTLYQTSLSKPLHALPATVATHTISAQGTPTVTEQFKYKDGRVAFYGRGFVGFTEVEKSLYASDVAGTSAISTETTFYHPDQFEYYNIDARAQNMYMYYESGRPWKKVLTTHRVNTGIGDTGATGDSIVTETRTLKGMLSDAGVPMWVPDTETTTQSFYDYAGIEFALNTSTTSYKFDQYGQPTSVDYEKRGADGTLLESRTTTTGYKRDQSFIDSWLTKLPTTITTVVTNDGDTITHTESRDYYPDGKVNWIQNEPDDPSQTITTTYDYNGRGNVLVVTRQAGTVSSTTTNHYDEADDLVLLVSGPMTNSMGYEYFGWVGQVATTVDANGLTTSRQIDPFGRETQSTDVNGKNTYTFYENAGLEGAFLTHNNRAVAYAVRTTGDGRPTTINFHDHFGRVIGTHSSDSDGIALETEAFYDGLGRKIARSHQPFVDGTQPEPLDHIDYDNLNRPIAITVASDTGRNSKVQYLLNYGFPTDDLGVSLPAGRIAAAVSAVQTVFPNGTRETKLLDAQSRTIAMADRNSSITTYSYGAVGKLLTFVDQANLPTTYQYDRYGRPTSSADPIRGLTTTAYSPLGDTVNRATPTDSIVTHYDLLNRPIDESTTTGTTTWSYDETGSIGKLANVTGPSNASSFSGHSVHYTYGKASDPVGNRGMLQQVTNTIAGEQFDIAYDYDNLARTSAVHYPAVAGGLRYAVEYQYSPGGRLSKVVEGDGGPGRTLWEITARDSQGRTRTAQSLNAMSVGYGYTGVEGLLKQLTATEGGQQKVELDYQYDVEDRVTSIGWREDGQFSDRSRVYQYDGAGRITDEFHAVEATGALQRGDLIDHVEYAPNGNIANKSDVGPYKYEALGNPYAVTSAGENNTYGYDDYGRQTTRTASYVPGGHQDVAWTNFDAPASVTSADGVTTTYEYNGLKERVLEVGPETKKVRIGNAYQRTDDLTAGQRTHSMLVSAGSTIIAEVEFVDSGAASSTAQGPTVASIVSDKLGSTSIVRDSSGNYIKRSYDAFGQASTNSPLKSGIDFAGYIQDSNTNLLWMNTRPYDAVIGRVLAPDPIINGTMGQDGANRYAYVYNHPTTFIDPSGFDGYYYDFNMDYSFDYSPSYDFNFDTSYLNMSVGTAGYYTPPADFSGGTSQMSYAGGQNYEGESGEWGASGAYCGDSYSSYMAAQYGALGESIANQQLGTYTLPAYPTVGFSGADPASSTGYLSPTGEPLKYYMGSQIHNDIAMQYRYSNPVDDIVTNTASLQNITSKMGGNIDGLGSDWSLRPDITNLTTAQMYEIKPLGYEAQGMQQLETYTAALNAAGLYVVPGGPGPGTSGVLTYPSGTTVAYGLSAPGLISYQLTLPETVPLPDYNMAPESSFNYAPLAIGGGLVAAGALVYFTGGAALPYVLAPAL